MTTINVYPEDRDLAKRFKQRPETWSDFLRRCALEAHGKGKGKQTDVEEAENGLVRIGVHRPHFRAAERTKSDEETWSEWIIRASRALEEAGERD
jgi:hypothetical protein